MASDLTVAVFDEDVQKAVAAAGVTKTLKPESPLSGPVTISRPAAPDDYVAAIKQRLAKFAGLTAAAVTVEAVAAILTPAATPADATPAAAG